LDIHTDKVYATSFGRTSGAAAIAIRAAKEHIETILNVRRGFVS
jgi:hypothetical protein